MDFSNEPYVRIYTTVTPNGRVWGFWGRVLMDELVKHADRAGVIDLPESLLDDLPTAVASVIGCEDIEWVRKYLPKLMAKPDPSLVLCKKKYLFLPRYNEAQYSPRSPAFSVKMSQKKTKDMDRARELGLPVDGIPAKKTA